MKDEIIYRGFTIEIVNDENPESPREWDNLGTMVCFHNRYNLGDTKESKRYDNPDDFLASLAGVEFYDDRFNGLSDQEIRGKLMKIVERENIILPLYLYDHSGITMSTSPFSCRWDSGQVGWIYVSKEAVKKEYTWDKLTKKRINKIEEYLKGEVETYDQYLTGDVYGFNIEVVGDSCYGFFGSDHEKSGLLDHARPSIDYYIKEKNKEHWERLKGYIKNHVPLLYRQPYSLS